MLGCGENHNFLYLSLVELGGFLTLQCPSDFRVLDGLL